jgi:hypothetical protein
MVSSLIAVIGTDFSLPTVISAMVTSETPWKVMFSFCEETISQKESSERVTPSQSPLVAEGWAVGGANICVSNSFKVERWAAGWDFRRSILLSALCVKEALYTPAHV